MANSAGKRDDWELAEITVFATVLFVTLYPRTLSDDRSFFGGDLSKPFRKCVFLIFSIKLFRWIALPDFRDVPVEEIQNMDGPHRFAAYLYFGLFALGSFGQGFLFLLLPYLLQTRLRGRINIRPGRDLTPWLLVAFSLSTIGAVGRMTFSSRMWAIKRVGDCISVFPVLRTVKLYRRLNQDVVTGSMVLQALLAVEMAVLVATSLSALSYATATPGQKDPLSGFRLAGLFTHQIRLVMHGFLLNMVDESMTVQAYAETGPDSDSDSMAIVRSLA